MPVKHPWARVCELATQEGQEVLWEDLQLADTKGVCSATDTTGPNKGVRRALAASGATHRD